MVTNGCLYKNYLYGQLFLLAGNAHFIYWFFKTSHEKNLNKKKKLMSVGLPDIIFEKIKLCVILNRH